LGGRALVNYLFPLVTSEINSFDLNNALNFGMLPRHYLVNNPIKRIQAYVGIYLQEEIKAEALTRNLTTFSRFLEIAAISNGEMLNFNNIATECGVSAPTVREYFSILEDTRIGYLIPAFKKVIKRRVILAPRFYFFDVGVTNFLLHRTHIIPGSPEYGKAFEHFIILEMYAYLNYNNSNDKLSYWRTASGFEVDAIIGDAKIAIEIKSSSEIFHHHLKGLKAFGEEFPSARKILVSNEQNRRLMGDVELIPVISFLNDLWNGLII
jgi:predicted AAA+ superfamily ATPase